MDDLARLVEALTTVRHEWCYLDERECPPTITAALCAELPTTPREEIATQLAAGAVYVNGQRVETDRPLTPPVRLEYFEPKIPLADEPCFDERWVVFEDDDLLAIVKPAGLTAMPARDQRYRNLKALIEKRLGTPVHMPSRLDTSTMGLVVVSKTPRMHPRLQHVFERRSVEKTYLLEVSGECGAQAQTVDNYIGRDPRHQVLRQVVTTGGKRAITTFRTIRRRHLVRDDGTTATATLLWAQPLTGRTHQIRVHAAHLGTPIIGDNFYGGVTASTLHLACYRLTFLHPMSGAPLSLEIPPTHTPAWVGELPSST